MPEVSVPRRGEVWWINFSPTRGREQRGDRPALIISDDRLNASPAELVIAIPMTTTRRGVPWHVEVQPEQAEGLGGTGYVMCDQVQTVSRERLRRHGARPIDSSVLEEVEDRLRILMGL
jgi:mRNA interferase MazF